MLSGPSITRKGNDYYLVNSSFAMVPGVPIFHSKDLVNWKQIGHVLDRPSQLKVEQAGISAGIYAPDIKYNPHNNTFYMITTQIAGGFGNMVVKTQDPAKGWSDPVKLKFDGIDPSLFFDDNGKAYLVHNDAPPRDKTLVQWPPCDQDLGLRPGKRCGDRRHRQDHRGWRRGYFAETYLDRRAAYLQKNGRYYLMCAEGGTGDGIAK